MRADERDPLTERIIGCAIEVHRTLGPGLLENTYQGVLTIELQHGGFSVDRERVFPALYRGIKVGDYSTAACCGTESGE